MNDGIPTELSRPFPPTQLPTRVAFNGDRDEFRRLVTKGAVLELITFGFYRFWLTTDIRRHLWSNTLIDGDAVEYTGRGKELLLGFLFALAILLPIYLIYFLIGIEAERLRAFASIPLFVGSYAFGQFAIYRARRYRLTRTVWRGVRFWMDGSGWAYSLRATLWNLLVSLTLGLALPWREAALERYKMRHSYYGELRGDFTGAGWEFFKSGWWIWLLSPFAIIFFPLAPFFYAEFKVRQWRWWLSGIRMGGVRLESTLPNFAFQNLYWLAILWFTLLSVVYVVYVVVAWALVGVLGGAAMAPETPWGDISRIVLAVIGYIILALASNVVMRVYLQRDLWHEVVESIHVHDIKAAMNVQARGELASALGEGFADGLDVAGF